MSLGIDPKNDYAFKCVFGSEHHTRILVHLLNAVLKPSPDRRVEEVAILNPSYEPLKLDDKISILDIRARDQSGRQFDIEMQMASHPGLRDRFLYYWAKIYANQVRSGEKYDALNPVISICFLDWRLFPQTDKCQLVFQVQEPETGLAFSDHLAIHVFQLPNFKKRLEELDDPLDKWLYFLNNGEDLSPEDIPESIRIPEVEEAMSVLKALTEEEREWHRYFDREKARRDALNWQLSLEDAQAKVQKAEADLERAQAEAERAQVEGLIGQVRLCEELLNLAPTPAEQLDAMRPGELQHLVDQLRCQKQT